MELSDMKHARHCIEICACMWHGHGKKSGELRVRKTAAQQLIA